MLEKTRDDETENTDEALGKVAADFAGAVFRASMLCAGIRPDEIAEILGTPKKPPEEEVTPIDPEVSALMFVGLDAHDLARAKGDNATAAKIAAELESAGIHFVDQ